MLSYVNNKFCFLNEAKISVNDRGYQFGDAVYEVIFYKNGRFLDLEGHIEQTKVQKALEELSFHTESLNILGVYEASIFRQKK